MSLEAYRKSLGSISKAKGWLAHFTATGRDGDRMKISSIGANPSICLQYTTCGNNYWDCKQDGGEGLFRAINQIIESRLYEITKEAIANMEKEAEKLKADAMKEYKELFNAELQKEEAA